MALHDLSLSDFNRLRSLLHEAGYSGTGIIDRFGAVEWPTPQNMIRPRLLRATEALNRLDVLVRLFLFDWPVETGPADAALGELTDLLLRSGLLEIQNGSYHAPLMILPYFELLLVCDWQDTPGRQPPVDFVMAFTSSTMQLVKATVPPAPDRPGSTLDLGTGSGIHAFLAAQRGERVCGTDINRRAIALARFSASLNGFPDIEFLHGSLFEPVAGRTFTKVLANPPFAVTPRRSYEYRDGGMPADGFTEAVLRQAPAHLEEGGIAQVVCQWCHVRGQDWHDRLQGWFAGSGCDVLVLQGAVDPVERYAEQWIRETEPNAPAPEALYEEWLDYYRRYNIEAVGTGLITFRKASGGRNWVHYDEGTNDLSVAFGDHIRRLIEAQDYLQHVASPESLLDVAWRPAPDLRLTQFSEPGDGQWRVASAQLSLAAGLRYTSNIDGPMAALIGRCDGRRTLGELAGELADRLRAPREKVLPSVAQMAVRLVARGCLLPPAAQASPLAASGS